MSSVKATVTGNGDSALPTVAITTLPTAMTAAAFLGIAWYLCAELNFRLLIRCTRRSLYFWACLICSWGIIIHSTIITLADFKVWYAHYSWLLNGNLMLCATSGRAMPLLLSYT